MTLLYEAPGPHECRGPNWYDHEVGSIWRCKCGQHWVRDERSWHRITPRRARKLLRRYGIEEVTE